VRELVVDAFWELSGWDGRFAATVRTLVRKPGRLTIEFLEGRRARYISPLRLYLMASLVYFVLAVAAPTVRTQDGKPVYLGLRVASTSSEPSRPQRVAYADKQSLDKGEELTPEERAAALESMSHAPRLIQPMLRRAIQDPAGFRRSLLEAMPRMLFALLPVFAGIIALFWRGRKYAEHLYFAIHLNAFVFLALAAVEAMKFTRAATPVILVSLISLAAVPIYATLAFRRVYGGGLLATLGKEVGVGVLYAVTWFVGFTFTLYFVSIFG
jgi:hypothetical protein